MPVSLLRAFLQYLQDTYSTQTKILALALSLLLLANLATPVCRMQSSVLHCDTSFSMCFWYTSPAHPVFISITEIIYYVAPGLVKFPLHRVGRPRNTVECRGFKVHRCALFRVGDGESS